MVSGSRVRGLPANKGSPMEEHSEWTKKSDTSHCCTYVALISSVKL